MTNQPTIHRPTQSESLSLSSSHRKPGAEPAASESGIPERFQSSPGATDTVDHALINKTKNQIRSLVTEIAELAKSNCTIKEFFEGFLNRTTSALASVGGAIWLEDSDTQQLDLLYHINVNQTPLANETTAQIRHTRLLKQLQQTSEPTLVPPNSGSSSPDEAGNPTDHLLIIGPLTIDQKTIGLVEVFQRSGAGPTTQRGYLRFLTQMCDIASDYLKNQRIREFEHQQELWQQLEQFIRSVHRGLDTDQTAYVIANESRRIIDCDRVSVAIAVGGRCQVKAISGLDSIERRADQVKRLGKLATAVIRAGEPLWYNGDDTDLPPQIEKRLHDYVDKSHTKMLAIIPLKEIAEGDDNESKVSEVRKRPLGVLIVEQLKDTRISPAIRRRIDVIVDHGQTALSNSIQHNRLFLMPLWKRLGKLTVPFKSPHLSKTLLGLVLISAVIGFFCFFPYPFSLGANGQLTPEVQHEVFAQVNGILQEVLIDDSNDHEQLVEPGQLLARMTNNDLMVEIQNLEGQISQTKEQIRKLQRARFDKELESIDDIMLDGELLKSIEAEKSLQRELAIKRVQAANLEIRSPARGVVVNWQVRQNLLRRPVERGQNLMTIVDPDTNWQVELEIPERRLGHLISRLRDNNDPIDVTFALASHPNRKLSGKLIRVDRKMEVYSDAGNAALVEVQFDNAQIPTDLLRSGTRVNAKIHCGTRSIGFVWFHELIETVQTSILFWF